MNFNPEIVSNIIIDGCDYTERTLKDMLVAAPGLLRRFVDNYVLTFFLPDAVKDQIVSLYMTAIRSVVDLTLRAVALFREMARGAGRPTDLRNAAVVLRDDVAVKTDALTDAMIPRALLGTQQEHWKSKATEAYTAGLTEQVDSAGGIGEVARSLERTLRDMADSIETFYGDLMYAWIGLAAAVVGVCLLPTGPGAIVGIILAILGLIMAIISVIVVFTNASSANASNAEGLLASPSVVWTKSAFAD